ncbi:ATP-dependent zinc protease [Thaumasiovibrio sp. DFM-14]|uniref:ATP-dependent zinc protease family protein n=1 Tax=Thaumasiovibrio sp. DFM-14 TaxID=3384792 RepID=UPI0039A26099
MRALIAYLLLAMIPLSANASIDSKKIVGETEFIQVESATLPFLARIDTGANSTSIHAFDIEVDGDEHTTHMRDNVGKTITFTTVNELGEESRVSSVIEKVSIIRNAQGEERRYSIMMDLTWDNETRPVMVNLRDRSKMTYKLLIGRNWLRGNYLVDVDLAAH